MERHAVDRRRCRYSAEFVRSVVRQHKYSVYLGAPEPRNREMLTIPRHHDTKPAPVNLAFGKVSFHIIRIQLDTKAGLVGNLHITVLHDRAFMHNNIIHPIAQANCCLAGRKITDCTRPLQCRLIAEDGARIADGHRDQA